MDDSGFLKRRGEYNPDVLSCLANLSNDEVFTPPELANKMLDLLPPELFANPRTRFLDPACKTGIFLREIAKRLMAGLEKAIPDEDKRREHIFRKQLFGIAITELTALMSRRSVYCSKDASCRYSVVRFADADGNIRFKPIRHSWENGRCVFCGASRKANDRAEGLETHAYEFIHTNDPKEIFNMHFDVIIGNPPYQMNVGVEKENYAVPIYQKFVLQSMKLEPRYLIMIIPARWYAGGRGLDEFRDMMLHDKRISHIADFPDADYCFPGVDIAGGVCYFKWERNKVQEDCAIITFDRNGMKSMMSRPLLEEGCDTLIRFNEAIPILRKIQKLAEPSFAELVSPQTPFGFVSSFTDYRSKPFPDAIKIYTSNGIGYVKREQIGKGICLVDKYKVYISKAYGERGAYPYFFLGKPFLGECKSCCTQTYLCIGPFHSKIVCENVMSYIRTRFFRFCVMLRRNTQDAMRQVYSFVPLQDFFKSWTDAELYKKYKLTAEEIAFIESMIKPME